MINENNDNNNDNANKISDLANNNGIDTDKNKIGLRKDPKPLIILNIGLTTLNVFLTLLLCYAFIIATSNI